MQSFTSFILNEEKPRVLRIKGPEAMRHRNEYIAKNINSGKPAVGKGGKHLAYAGKHPKIPEDSKVYIHHHLIDDKGQHHVAVSTTGHKKDAVEVPQNHIRKAASTESTENKGHQFERAFVQHAKKHGVMPINHTGAGSSSGHDAAALDKRVSSKEHKTGKGRRIWNIETKNTKGTTPAFGQATIHWNHEKKWHIPDHVRAKRPEYCREIEKHGIINHMNKHEPVPAKPEPGKQRIKTHMFDSKTAAPAIAYLKDHNAHILHTAHGTFSAHEKDPTGHGLPHLKGTGKFEVREKEKGKSQHRTVQFKMHSGSLKSHIDLSKDEDMRKFARHLGHNDVTVKSGD